MPNFAVLTELNTLGKMDKFLYDAPETTHFHHQHMQTTNFAVDQILTPMSGNNNTRFAEIEREGDLALDCYLVVDRPGLGESDQVNITVTKAGGLPAAIAANAEVNEGSNTIGTVASINATSFVITRSANASLPMGELTIGTVTLASNEYTAAVIEYDSENLVPAFGWNILKSVQLTIGNQCIERLSGAYLLAWYELADNITSTLMYNVDDDNMELAERLYIPLPFTFARNRTGVTDQALPLIGLQFHAVKVTINLQNLSDCIKGSPVITQPAYESATRFSTDPHIGDTLSSWNDFQFHLLTDQVYLDKTERMEFANAKGDMLIEQVQERMLSKHNLNRPFQLTYNHSIRELIWAVRQVKGYSDNTDAAIKEQLYGGTDDVDFYITARKKAVNGAPTFLHAEGIESVSLKLNNHERFHALGKYGSYFRSVQPHAHYDNKDNLGKRIYSYNFGLHPTSDQPSGSINMSRIDNVMMTLNTDIPDEEQDMHEYYVWARNYNILHIENGMGGLVLTS